MEEGEDEDTQPRDYLAGFKNKIHTAHADSRGEEEACEPGVGGGRDKRCTEMEHSTVVYL